MKKIYNSPIVPQTTTNFVISFLKFFVSIKFMFLCVLGIILFSS